MLDAVEKIPKKRKKIMFMPWCHVDKEYEFNGIKFAPHDISQPISEKVLNIMECHKDIQGKTIEHSTLVYKGQSPIMESNGDEVEIEKTNETVEIITFATLANRNYFGFGPYYNSEHFTLYTQIFTDAQFISFVTRRREGSNIATYPTEEVSLTVSPSCKGVQEVSLDERLIDSLLSKLSQDSQDKLRWLNSIYCFNQANTDNPNFREEVELVLLCSSFQEILNAKSNARDVAEKFSQLFNSHESIQAKKSERLRGSCYDPNKTLRYNWMHKFYKMRNDFAHGNIVSDRPTQWTLKEHLMLATIAFPLIVKSFLAEDESCDYELTDKDHAQIDAFEQFADTEGFMNEPTDCHNSFDSHWSRLCDKKQRYAEFRNFYEEFLRKQSDKKEL